MNNEFQILTAIGICEGRISTGTEIDKAFEWLKEEVAEILSGIEIYDEETEAEKVFNKNHPEANP